MNPEFYAGAAARNIVPPPEIVNNSLHPNMTVRFDELGSPLQVKALFMRCHEQSWMLLAMDSVGMSWEQAYFIRQGVAEAAGLSMENIVVSASHSHSTPFLEHLTKPHPYLDFVKQQAVDAAIEAGQMSRPARFGHAMISITGASFNTRSPVSNGKCKFVRDFREGSTSTRPVDTRMNIIRIDDDAGRPIAGWVRFAAHPACVIFNTPISAEYPGYLTDSLGQTVAGGAPVLFSYGASGDVNCIPMFGQESDSKKLGHSLAHSAAPVFERIKTQVPRRFLAGHRTIELPLDAVPSVQTLDKEMAEMMAFTSALDREPDLEWVLGVNCKKEWTVAAKKAYVAPLAEWTRLMKQAISSGRTFPSTWPSRITSWIVDDLGFVFYPGEPFAKLGLELNARSPLSETLVVAMSNGCDGYLGTDQDRQDGGYETYTSPRYEKLAEDKRPLPYALGAGECFLRNCLELIKTLLAGQKS
jgi:hypothetical protein